MKNIRVFLFFCNFYLNFFCFLQVKFNLYLNRRVFVMRHNYLLYNKVSEYFALTRLCRMVSSNLTLMFGPLKKKEGFLLSHVPCFIEIPVFNANRVNPDQTPRSLTSDLSLHCLPVFLSWDAKHKRVNKLCRRSSDGIANSVDYLFEKFGAKSR